MTVSSNYSSYNTYASSGTNSARHMSKPSFEEIAQTMLSTMDSDGDGSISSTEFTSANSANSSASDIFTLLDTDSSGSMSTEELISALKNMKPPEPPQGENGSMPPPPSGGMPPPPPPSDASSSSESSDSSLSEIFSSLDTNQDGTISMDELSALFEDSKKDTDAEKTSSTAASTISSTDNSMKQVSNDWLQKLLSYYSNNTASSTSTSLISVSA